MYIKREEVENWLNEMMFKNYVINKDLTVDVNEDVYLSNKELKEIPIQFGIVRGNFFCDNNKLTSLKGCPRELAGSFYCYSNMLKNLEYCPEVLNESFYCDNNELTSLKYFPKEVNGKFIIMNVNKIKEIELINLTCDIKNVKEIHSDFNKDGNKEEFLDKLNFYKNIKKENELLKELSVASHNIKLNKKL